MISFKEYLGEYRKAPLGSEFSQFELQHFMADEDNLKQLRVISKVDNQVVFTYEYSFDNNNKVFILTAKEDLFKIFGYLFITKKGKYWQSSGTAIFDPYKRRGLGIDMYLNVINSGYQLINGNELSTSSEAVWLKLKDLTKVNVINLKTDEIEEWSNKPSKDISSETWFWITELKEEVRIPSDIYEDIRYKTFLRNKPFKYQFGIFCERYLEEGEF